MENYDQTNIDQDYHNPKIRTPAALFSKSSRKSPISRLRKQPQASQPSLYTDPCCDNHQNKHATYYTQIEGDMLHFCDKCATTLASTGYTITKIQGQNNTNVFTSPAHSNNSNSRFRITQSQKKHSRESEVSGFLHQLKDMRLTITSTKENIKEKLIQSQEFYGQQIQDINNYFSLIIKSLELEKHKCYNHILTSRQEAQEQIRKIDFDLIDIDQGLTKILMDIEDNLQTVYSIDDDMYSLVIQQYDGQKGNYQNCLSGLLLEPIQMKRIQFQGVPESIYNLSDIVIQNSVKHNQNQQYRLVDSLNSEELGNIRAISPDKYRNEANVQNSFKQDSLKFSFEAQKLKNQLSNVRRKDGIKTQY